MVIAENQITMLLYTLAGAFGTSIIGMVFYFVKGYFDSHKKKGEKAEKDNSVITKELSDFRVQTVEAYSKVKTRMAENNTVICGKLDDLRNQVGKSEVVLQSRVNELSLVVSQSIKDQGKIEGRLDEHMNLLTSYISTMGHMSRQLEAIFKFIDAKPRATDVQSEKDASRG